MIAVRGGTGPRPNWKLRPTGSGPDRDRAPISQDPTTLASGPHHLEVDFTHVTFCDCSGLNTLLRARAAARQAGVAFQLAHTNAQNVIRLFDLTESSPFFGIGLVAA
ncbi:STAS domain-containing protein [Streptomyces sp. NPDC002187]|uniref:STAS domain-containing protein n=1 Tax=Streptomyces sp. NPDC002187 TaxID=3364637 RepID=UPI0036BE1332